MTKDMPEKSRLERQMDFVREIDKLKTIGRQTLLMDGSRYENDAEHSWHLSLMALVLGEYSNAEIDTLKVLKMVLIHDLVEIHAGDTFCYDEAGNKTKPAREKAAADALFGLLPEDQACSMRDLWEEFETLQTHEARFAASLDRLQPVMHNCATRGAAWKKHGIKKSMVESRNSHIRDGSTELWNEFRRLIDDASEQGFLPE